MKFVLPLYLILWKKTPNDTVTPQRQSQFTAKMKANTVPHLLSSFWCELTNTMNVTEWRVSWNSWNLHKLSKLSLWQKGVAWRQTWKSHLKSKEQYDHSDYKNVDHLRPVQSQCLETSTVDATNWNSTQPKELWSTSKRTLLKVQQWSSEQFSWICSTATSSTQSSPAQNWRCCTLFPLPVWQGNCCPC